MRLHSRAMPLLLPAASDVLVLNTLADPPTHLTRFDLDIVDQHCSVNVVNQLQNFAAFLCPASKPRSWLSLSALNGRWRRCQRLR